MASDEFKVNPEQLRAEAAREPRRSGLDDYLEVIRLLKEEKEFSFRGIAAWLRQRGLKVDHNAVWRAYSKATLSGQGGKSTEQNERYERRRPSEGAMPWLGQS